MNHKLNGLGLGIAFLLVYFLGCASAGVSTPPVAHAQTGPAAAGLQRWEYFCTEGYNAETIIERANQAGAQGWEMVAGLGSPRVHGLWCFKRPL